MPRFFVDLHVHIGATANNMPVKITASRKLSLQNIIKECTNRKGIQIVGIVDCASPLVQEEINGLISDGILCELPEGGLRYHDHLTIMMGVEIESCEARGGRGHFINFFPTLERLKQYSNILAKTTKNLSLSTQQCYLPAVELLLATEKCGGFFFPAHSFTPHKSLFGSCGNSLKEVFKEEYEKIKIIELGLSADSQMADMLTELHKVTFLSNSDAHSLEKIGREYNIIQMKEPSYKGLTNALYNIEGKVIANYGLNPVLGKYHRNYCENCRITFENFTEQCPFCLKSNIIKGVYDRLLEIGNSYQTNLGYRPPYFYQVPLSFLPKVGIKTINKLLSRFGTEMNVLHTAEYDELAKIAGINVADLIIKARKGELRIVSGGGGTYGKIM